METITHLNLTVSGFPFTKITQMFITHEPNSHGRVCVVGELDPESADECIKRTDESTFVTITTNAEEQEPKLFCGYVDKISMLSETQYSSVRLDLISASTKADTTKHNHSFQNTAKTYGQILEQSVASTADIHMMVSDKAIGALIVQYNETGWEFALRMASQLKAPLVADLVSPKAQLYVGLPPARRSHSIDGSSFHSGIDNSDFSNSTSNYGAAMREDFAGQQVTTYEYAFIGDKCIFNGQDQTIKSVTAQLVDGILTMNYGLLTANAGKASGGSVSSLAKPPMQSAQTSGKMMRGTVQAVAGDKVQVHLTDVDSGYDGGGSWWFPYSTAYSSSDGSGWYCMPEVGDQVRVFFPSGSEGDAFAASSVCAEPPLEPRHKRWKAPGGKQILLTDEGIYIFCEEGKIYINLTQENGIEIQGDKGISIVSGTYVEITATDEIQLAADNQIVIGTPNSYLLITKEAATLTAPTVNIS